MSSHWTPKIKLLLVLEFLWTAWLISPITIQPAVYLIFGFFSLPLFILPLATVPVALLTARRVKGDSDLVRRKLPRWLRWMETPDYLLPGDMREGTIKRLYDGLYFGLAKVPGLARCNEWIAWFFTSWVWIGYRNVGHGILWYAGWPTPRMPQWLSAEELLVYGTQIKYRKVLFLWLMWGNKTVDDVQNTIPDLKENWYWAVPWWSIRLKKRGDDEQE